MTTAAKLLADALELPEAEREDLAAQLLDSVEPPPGISIEDEAERGSSTAGQLVQNLHKFNAR